MRIMPLCGPSWKLKLARMYARLKIHDGPSVAIKYKIHDVWSSILFSLEEAASMLIVVECSLYSSHALGCPKN